MVFNKKENKVALITGASRLKGIGAAICQRLAADGIDIFFTYWSKYDDEQPWGFELNEPELLKNEIEKHNVRCFKKEIDLARPENINKLLDEVVDKIGIPSILINNAAYSTSSSFKDIDNELLDKHYYINLRLTILLSAKFARLFDKKEGGRIISLTSGQFKGPVNFSHLIKNKIRKELVKLKTILSTVFNKIYTFSISHVGNSRIEKVEGQRLKTLSLL